jgi:hypothetical protein
MTQRQAERHGPGTWAALVGGTLTVLTLAALLGSMLTDRPVPALPVTRHPATAPAAQGTAERAVADVPSTVSWWSGAAGDAAADGRYGVWRGTPVRIGGTWADGNAEQLEMYAVCRGACRSWNKPLDLAVGAIDVGRGESWAAAARGVYVPRWRRSLLRLRQCWGHRDPALLYLRFAHEMNLPNAWRVRAGEEAAFVKAITLYSSLRYEILPTARVVLCPNDGTDASLGRLDLRKLWPGRDGRGRQVVNVYAVDSYNMYPHVTTHEEFVRKIEDQDGDGTPIGIERHRRLAERLGVPFAIGEWSNNGSPNRNGGGGESPLYVREFHAWAAAHAGDPAHPRPGQLLYEVHFDLWTEFAFWPRTVQPHTAAAYRALPWGRPAG